VIRLCVAGKDEAKSQDPLLTLMHIESAKMVAPTKKFFGHGLFGHEPWTWRSTRVGDQYLLTSTKRP
jgi:hypothetical protein